MHRFNSPNFDILKDRIEINLMNIMGSYGEDLLANVREQCSFEHVKRLVRRNSHDHLRFKDNSQAKFDKFSQQYKVMNKCTVRDQSLCVTLQITEASFLSKLKPPFRIESVELCVVVM